MGQSKSTLIKILSGFYPPDDGRIFLKEKKSAFLLLENPQIRD